MNNPDKLNHHGPRATVDLKIHPAPVAKKRILVVDDEWSMRELLSTVMDVYGFEPLLASNSAEFREIIRTQKVDAIILDLMLGNEDGMVVYNALVPKHLSPNIPVIFISALVGDRPSTFPQKNRKFSLIGKPFDTDKLVQALRTALEHK